MKWMLPIVSFLLVLDVTVAAAAAPRTIGYQGVLTDSQGAVVADGTYSMTFRIYATASGSAVALWSETRDVAVNEGRFDVILGSVTPLSLAFDRPYWLGLQVGSDPEMTPRTALAGAPYSHRAYSVEDGAVTSTTIADDTVVRSLNGLDDTVSIVGEGDISVTSVRDELRISSSSDTPPGVAGAKGITSGSLTGPGTIDLLVSRTLDCPSDGYVLVIGSGHVFLHHANGNPTWARLGTSDDPTAIPSNRETIAQIPFNVASGTFIMPFASQALYQVSAGTNTFYVLGEKSGNGSASVGDLQLSLVFIDSAYGTVSSNSVDEGLETSRAAGDPRQ